MSRLAAALAAPPSVPFAVVFALVAATVAAGSWASPAGAQERLALADRPLLGGPEASFGARTVEQPVQLDDPLVTHDGPYVVVHLAENRVYLMEGAEAVWSTPAGTGTGLDLHNPNAEHDWKFSTPRGLFQVRHKERDPVWEAPDWYFIENGRPVPPEDHPSRSMRGMLGNTAIYLGDGLAIHGTDRPGLILNGDPEARRVSHGCIRLTNEAARTLFHMVDVGTPVLIF